MLLGCIQAQSTFERVHAYVTDQLQRVLCDAVSAREFVFVREYRGRLGYKTAATAPALTIARYDVVVVVVVTCVNNNACCCMQTANEH